MGVTRGRNRRGGFQRKGDPARTQVIGRDVPRDRQRPGRERREIAPVAMPRLPRLLERSRRQILRVQRRAESIAEEIVNAWHLLGVHRIPVRFSGADPAQEPPGHRLVECHLGLYTERVTLYHGRSGRRQV
jgi:hypothetical protein